MYEFRLIDGPVVRVCDQTEIPQAVRPAGVQRFVSWCLSYQREIYAVGVVLIDGDGRWFSAIPHISKPWRMKSAEALDFDPVEIARDQALAISRRWRNDHHRN